jgi:hypothetical protein
MPTRVVDGIVVGFKIPPGATTLSQVPDEQTLEHIAALPRSDHPEDAHLTVGPSDLLALAILSPCSKIIVLDWDIEVLKRAQNSAAAMSRLQDIKEIGDRVAAFIGMLEDFDIQNNGKSSVESKTMLYERILSGFKEHGGLPDIVRDEIADGIAESEQLPCEKAFKLVKDLLSKVLTENPSLIDSIQSASFEFINIDLSNHENWKMLFEYLQEQDTRIYSFNFTNVPPAFFAPLQDAPADMITPDAHFIISEVSKTYTVPASIDNGKFQLLLESIERSQKINCDHYAPLREVIASWIRSLNRDGPGPG